MIKCNYYKYILIIFLLCFVKNVISDELLKESEMKSQIANKCIITLNPTIIPNNYKIINNIITESILTQQLKNNLKNFNTYLISQYKPEYLILINQNNNKILKWQNENTSKIVTQLKSLYPNESYNFVHTKTIEYNQYTMFSVLDQVEISQNLDQFPETALTSEIFNITLWLDTYIMSNQNSILIHSYTVLGHSGFANIKYTNTQNNYNFESLINEAVNNIALDIIDNLSIMCQEIHSNLNQATTHQ